MSPEAPGGQAITALSLNLQAGQSWDPADPDGAPYDLDASIRFLRAQDCDLLLLQEVEMPDAPRPTLAQRPNYERLRRAFPDYQSCFAWPATERPQLPFGIGLAVFSRLPLRDPFHVVLPTSELPFSFGGSSWLPAERSVLGATVLLGGRAVQVLCTHLQAWFMLEASADDHPAQREVLATLLRGRKGPTILGGDFNCTPGEGTVPLIESCGMRTVQRGEVTWLRRPLVLDHLFHSPEFAVREATVVPTTVSDHHAVRAAFSLD